MFLINKILRRNLNRLLILICVAIWGASHAQLTDTFSDGEYTTNPNWTPDDPSNWVIDNGMLRSNSSVASSSFWISTPSARATGAQWDFFINLQFNTSSANYVDVYLVSTNQNLNAPGNSGYFVRIGGTPDEISLYRIIAGTATILINGTDGVTNSSNNVLRIRVIRDATGRWTLSYNATGSGNVYHDEPSVVDNTVTTSSYFGIRVVQSTSTFFNRHYFDDFYAGNIIPDTQPPQILSVTALSSTQAQVAFNERLEPASAQHVTHYQVNQGVGQPSLANLLGDERTVVLTFINPFPNGPTCQLTVSGVTDLAGNATVSATRDFFYFQPSTVNYKDVIFTELFPDPTPAIGLPEAEFAELFNRSANPVSLAGWKLSDPSSTATLPAYILLPGNYVIITTNAAASMFSSYAVLGVSGFPTLNNSGDQLRLRDPTDQLIDEVIYTDGWYKDDDKRQGGWTLELIDLQNICGEEENWVASEDPAGGTPGKVNSVNANKPDLTGPKLISAIPVTPTQVKLRFNEKLYAELPLPADFLITPPIAVTSVSFASATMRDLLLDINSAVQPQQNYTITALQVRDCSGNIIHENFSTVSFGLPEPALALDVVINELLFNPKPFGVDFIELINRSQKYLNLKNWSIGNFENGTAINLKLITSDDFLLPPGGIAAFTPDPFTILSHYPKAQQGNIIRVNALPAFPDAEGTSCVVTEAGIVLDNFRYTRDNHSVFLRDKEGVSLERIHPGQPSNNPNNWKSAASTAGFATPGLPNSNALATQLIAGHVKIEPEIFIPLYGQPDFTEIRYSFDQGGWVANIKILDQQGREIKRLANNETLSTEGYFRWDGDRDDGTKARPGYYVVWFEAFDTNGTVETFRKRVVVAARY